MQNSIFSVDSSQETVFTVSGLSVFFLSSQKEKNDKSLSELCDLMMVLW